MNETLQKLNLGSGTDTREGWVNLDIAPLPGVDVVHDLNQLPLPFSDEAFGIILCHDILEHVDMPAVLRECHRILAPGGRMEIEVPHFTSSNNFVDPTHRRLFSVKTFRFFVGGTYEWERRGNYYFDFHFSGIEEPRLTFPKGISFAWNWIVDPLVNFSYATRCYYEASGWARLFPAENIRLTLVK